MATLLDELFRYVGFGPEDGARLMAASGMMTPAFDSIVDRFYVAIDANPEARAVFEDEAQVARQKKLLRAWLVRFFAGPYDDSYYEERARIGRAHVRIGLPQRYVFVSMNVIRSGLTEAVAQHGGPEVDAVLLQSSIHRLCDVELAIMLETYREDYDLALRAAERLAALGQFAGTVAHEMRNPLAVLSTSSHLLRRHAGDQPDLLRHVDRVERQVAICGQIVDDLLALARDRAPSFEDVSLHPLIEFAWAQLPTSPHTLSLTMAESSLSLRADPGQLRQVLVNLLQNATQAMSDGGVVSVHVGPAPDDELGRESVRIRVEDAGAGFSPDALEHLFEPLYTTKARGIGLGLPLCQRVVAKHRGKLTAGNREPHGGRVDIVLPLTQPSQGGT